MIGNEIRLHLGKSLVKSMIKIQNVIELRGGHWAVRCFGKNGNCDEKGVNVNIGTWHHYRSTCSRGKADICEVSRLSYPFVDFYL